MWTLSQVQAEYRRLDRLLGIDTGRVAVSFSKRMTRQYGVCTFVKNKPQEIRLADFLRQEDQVFWDTARHEYAHAAVALLTGKRHGHDEAWKAVCRKIGCPPERLAPNCNAAVENRKRIEAVRVCRDVPRLRDAVALSAARDGRAGTGGTARRHPLPPVRWEEIQT